MASRRATCAACTLPSPKDHRPALGAVDSGSDQPHRAGVSFAETCQAVLPERPARRRAMLHRVRQETRNARTVRILSDVELSGYSLTARTARTSPTTRAYLFGSSDHHPRALRTGSGRRPSGYFPDYCYQQTTARNGVPLSVGPCHVARTVRRFRLPRVRTPYASQPRALAWLQPSPPCRQKAT